MNCFHKVGFVIKETERVNVVESFLELDPELGYGENPHEAQ